jgi:hypothetical protein
VLYINPSVGNPDPEDFEIKGADKIQDLIHSLRAGELCGYYDACCDCYQRIGFFADQDCVVRLEFDGGHTLRWTDGKWPGLVFMTPAAATAFCQWFDRNGYPNFEKWRQQTVAYETQERERITKFFAEFPAASHQFLEKRISIFNPEKEQSALDPARSIVDTMGSPVDAAVCVFRAYGASRSSWDGYDNTQIIADSVIALIDDEKFASAMEQIKDDRTALLGAGRFFFGNTGLGRKAPFEVFPEDERVEWALRLGDVAITDGDNEQKRSCRQALEKFGDNPDIRRFLAKFAETDAAQKSDGRATSSQQ